MTPEEFAVFHQQVRHTLAVASSLTTTVFAKVLVAAKNVDPETPGAISVYESAQELASLTQFLDQQLAGLATVAWGKDDVSALCLKINARLNEHRAQTADHAAVEAEKATHEAPSMQQ